MESEKRLPGQQHLSAQSDVFTIWRPLSLRRSNLICTTLATFSLLGITILVHVIDSRQESIFESSRGGTLSAGQQFLVRYLPTILLVIYGTWVSMLDLDVKRLEPWFQLSLPPASSKLSPLLCRYDTDFIFTVIAKALSCRHWVILGSSLLIIISTVAVPAVQSSMLTVRMRDIQHQHAVSSAANLTDLDGQKFLMNSNMMLSAYAIAWLGQAAPAFCTNEYALAPFRTTDIDTSVVGSDPSKSAIIASTTRYWSGMTCWAPTSISINFTTNTVSFDDGQGCVAHDLLSFDADIISLYSNESKYEAYYHGGGAYGYNLSLPTLLTECPDRPRLALLTWRKAGASLPDFAPGGNATAMFCEATYYSEPVNATIKASDFSVLSYQPTGPRSEIPDESFNKTHFEFIISYGEAPVDTITDNGTLTVDVLDADEIGQGMQLLDRGIMAPIQQSRPTMIGTMLGITGFPIDAYLDFNTLEAAYEKAHHLLFTHAIRRVFDFDVGLSTTIERELSERDFDSQTAILTVSGEVAFLNPRFTIATEVLLLIVCALCIFCLVAVPRRPLKLYRNPDSLAEIMMLSRSRHIQDVFAGISAVSDQDLNLMVRDASFYLDRDDHGALLKRKVEGEVSLKDNVVYNTPDTWSTNSVPPKHSLELSWTTSTLVGLLLLASAIFLTVLNVLIKRRNGLRLPSSSTFTQQFLFNFLPTIAATLLALYLILLCRVYSFIKPMHELSLGGATAAKTLLVDYTSIPPQLLFAKAFRSGHYLLGILSVATLLSNVLTVTTASMFISRQIETVLPVNLTQNFEPNVVKNSTVSKIDSTMSMNEPAYLITLNLTDNIKLPSWTTEEYGFIPLELESSAIDQKSPSYRIETLGFGADLECTNLLAPEPRFNVSGNIVYHDNGTTFQVWANYTRAEGDVVTCVVDTQDLNSWQQVNLTQLSTSPSAMEVASTLSRWAGKAPFADDFCASRIVRGWLRAKLEVPVGEDQTPRMVSNATVVACQPRLKTRSFLVEATASGDILSARPLTPEKFDLPPSANMSETLSASLISMGGYLLLARWHNDTVARDYSNCMFRAYLGHRDWLNASMPLPSVQEAGIVMSEIFSRTFAVRLYLDRSKLQRVNVQSQTKKVDERDIALANTNQVSAEAVVLIQKLFMSLPNFAISMSIIIFDLLVLVAFRLNLPQPFLPRMPFTIASQIAFFSGSHVIDDVVKAGSDFKELDKQGYRYAYGKYIGKDGWVHTGIEREQYVSRI